MFLFDQYLSRAPHSVSSFLMFFTHMNLLIDTKNSIKSMLCYRQDCVIALWFLNWFYDSPSKMYHIMLQKLRFCRSTSSKRCELKIDSREMWSLIRYVVGYSFIWQIHWCLILWSSIYRYGWRTDLCWDSLAQIRLDVNLNTGRKRCNNTYRLYHIGANHVCAVTEALLEESVSLA